jgi:hypothetical protein
VPIVVKSDSLNLLEPSGPVKACNGIAIPLPLTSPVIHKKSERGEATPYKESLYSFSEIIRVIIIHKIE